MGDWDYIYIHPLVMTNSLPWKMAHIEIDGVPIKHVDLPWLCLITKWYIYIYIYYFNSWYESKLGYAKMDGQD